jgi:hypothetical protein
MLGTILLVFAFVIMCLAAANWPAANAGRWTLGWLALAFYFASILFGGGSIERFFH